MGKFLLSAKVVILVVGVASAAVYSAETTAAPSATSCADLAGLKSAGHRLAYLGGN